MSRTQVQLLYNQFKKGREEGRDDTHPGRLRTSTTDKNFEAVKKMILDNSRITIREVADDVDKSFSSSRAIFMDVLVMKRAASKIVFQLLNFEQK